MFFFPGTFGRIISVSLQICQKFLQLGRAAAPPFPPPPPNQGRSQDFSVGTHSFPSHLFTPPPPKKKDQSHFRFTCLLFQIYKYKYIWNIFFYLFFYFIYLFIYFFIIIFRYAIAYLRTGSYAPANPPPDYTGTHFSFGKLVIEFGDVSDSATLSFELYRRRIFIFTSSAGVSRWIGSRLSIKVLITNGKPMPRLMSNTFDPMAFETAISPNPSRATMIELKASWNDRIILCSIIRSNIFARAPSA